MLVKLKALALTVALALVFAPAAAADATLNVEGTGSVFVTPDVADLSVSVTRTAPTSSLALSRANRAIDAIIGAVGSIGIPTSGFQTQNVNVSFNDARVGPRHHKHSVRTWTANESLGIHITKISLVGPAIDRSTSAGASSVDGPSFSFSDPSEGAVKATTAAINDARRRANAAAAALGYVVSGVQSVVLDPSGGVMPPAAGAPSVKRVPGPVSAPTQVLPGAQEVDSTVDVVFLIAPA